MNVVGISGAQGAGKSTLLVELQKRNWKLDSFRVSRSVQAQFGWDSLDEVMSDPLTMMEFQEEVFRQKYKNDWFLHEKAITMNSDSSKDELIVLTERTFADIVAYTCHWTWTFVDDRKMTLGDAMRFLGPFVKKCSDAQKQIYDGVILLPYMADTIVWENDPNRASRSTVDTIYEDIERFVQSTSDTYLKHFTISTKSISDRADQVETFLRSL